MRIQLQVSGMSCGHCVQAVRNALASIPGATVESVEVGSAIVNVDESRVTVGALIDAIQDAGYDAQEAAA